MTVVCPEHYRAHHRHQRRRRRHCYCLSFNNSHHKSWIRFSGNVETNLLLPPNSTNIWPILSIFKHIVAVSENPNSWRQYFLCWALVCDINIEDLSTKTFSQTLCIIQCQVPLPEIQCPIARVELERSQPLTVSQIKLEDRKNRTVAAFGNSDSQLWSH